MDADQYTHQQTATPRGGTTATRPDTAAATRDDDDSR